MLVAILAFASASAPLTCTFQVSPGKGLRGGNTTKVRSADTADACCAACEAAAACDGWVLEKANESASLICRLKVEYNNVYDCPLCTFAGTLAPPSCPSQPPAPRPPAPARTRPHVIAMLQDDLGYDDVAFNGNDVNLDVTGNITAAAREGVILERHYVHWHCSPTRRSLLTGRLPLHHSEYLSSVTSDDIDLRWRTIGQKLQGVGYSTYWIGKGHTGYKSFHHLPTQLGFDEFVGFLDGAQSHFASKRWRGLCPFDDANTTYSADLYGAAALAVLEGYEPAAPGARPLFFYLPWQNVHAPYDAPHDWPASADVLRGMLASTDAWVGRLLGTLKDKGMWERTVLLYSADNGGTQRGCNWPLRGGKHSNWEVRPVPLRSHATSLTVRLAARAGCAPRPSSRAAGCRRRHAASAAAWCCTWPTGASSLCSYGGSRPSVRLPRTPYGRYATIASLGGADPTDDPPVPPLPVDPADPSKDIYGKDSFPPVDGVDAWPVLSDPAAFGNATAAHAQLWLSAEVLVRGRYKLVVAQQEPAKTNNPPEFGWKCGGSRGTRCDTRNSSAEEWVDATPAQMKCGCAFKNRSHFTPCLFDVADDVSEFSDLAPAHEPLVNDMWRALNLSNLELYGQSSHSPPALLGPCNASCAQQYFARFGSAPGPICGVPGCQSNVGPSAASSATTPYYDSAFVFGWNARLASFSPSQTVAWLQNIAALKISHITIQATSKGVAYPGPVSGTAAYPSTVQGIRQSGSQWVSKLLTAADSVGIKVALGLFEADGPPGNCMTGLDPSDPAGSLGALASTYSAVAKDLAAQFGHHTSLAGFYLPLELSNVCLPSQPELAGSRFLEPAAKTIRSLGLTSSCSPLFNADWGGQPQDPTAVGAWWASVVAAAPSLDRIEMQDKRSMNPLATTMRFMRALSTALAGKITLWSNAEAFRIPSGTWNGTEFPADIADIKEQLSEEAPLVSGFTFWSFDGFMDPTAGSAAETKLYNAYKAYVDG